MDINTISWKELIFKSMVVHTVTYFIFGVISFLITDYPALFSDPGVAHYFRDTSDPLVMAGPLFQPIRGILLGIVIYLLRETFFQKPRGWLILWLTLVIIGILSPYVGAPGSLEGFIYTKVPISVQLSLMPEVIFQTIMFSFVLFYWVNNPRAKWLSWLLYISLFFIILFPALGLIFGQPAKG